MDRKKREVEVVLIIDAPKVLYHTTQRNNDLTKVCWEQAMDGRPEVIKPPVGEYHTDLSIGKYFTLHSKLDYSSPWMFPENTDQLPDKEKPEVFLEYQLHDNMSLRLLDCTKECCLYDYNQVEEIIKQNGYDGYLGKSDYYEIYLVAPSKFIKGFTEIPFCRVKKDRDYINAMNIETEKMLGLKPRYEVNLRTKVETSTFITKILNIFAFLWQ
jgi:hypothetical protein